MAKTLLALFVLLPFLLTAQVADKSDGNNVFEKVVIEAGFPGGPVKWIEFVKKNFSFTNIEKNIPDSVSSFSDTAKIQFIVDKNGVISNISFLSGISKSFKESCIEIFKDSPHWQPANQCGRNVNAYRKQTFIVQIDKSSGKRLILVRE
jgi:hypothetical protein